MLVVSDTTPIISLLKIEKLELLRDLYREVVIPKAVYDELTSNDAYAAERNAVDNADYITTKEVKNGEEVKKLQAMSGLQLGESEALVLANEIKADLLLVDEVPGRNMAREMQLDFTGTIGILVQAIRCKKLSGEEVEDCVDTLRQNGRHISKELYEILVQEASKSATSTRD